MTNCAHQEDIRHIVMLTNLVEDGKKKAEKYWPEADKPLTFVKDQRQSFNVKLIEEEEFALFTSRRLALTLSPSSGQKNENEREILQVDSKLQFSFDFYGSSIDWVSVGTNEIP